MPQRNGKGEIYLTGMSVHSGEHQEQVVIIVVIFNGKTLHYSVITLINSYFRVLDRAKNGVTQPFSTPISHKYCVYFKINVNRND